MDVLKVNVNGIQLTTAAFLPLLQKGEKKLVLNVYEFFFSLLTQTFLSRGWNIVADALLLCLYILQKYCHGLG